ncbi:MAG TPA: glutathione S-transferase family protein [Burkholderiales bacterium]|nr:glutathione S-transferase family protein [Burkholderiales bacterium]
MSEIILHHYPASPVSEKVRIALGLKRLSWRSVEIPRVPPKPDVMPLTGGYRRTPFMQIGADIYCDSQLILREIERRHPDPRLQLHVRGLQWMINRWIEGVFDSAVRVAMSANADQLPEDFVRDRARLFLGPHGDFRKLKGEVPHYAAQLRAQLGWIDERLADGSRFLLGDQPSFADAACYSVVWFVRGRWAEGPALLAQFPHLEGWEQRVKAIGHGISVSMTSSEALDIARAAQPAQPGKSDAQDAQGLALGQKVTATPMTDSGEASVAGIVHRVSRDSIGIVREDARVGTVCVHFPRVGYRVERV